MFEWKVEDMILRNQTCNIFLGREKIYSCESKTSREDKIAFVDDFQDGKLSYLLELLEKYSKESDSLPKDSWGNVKTVSLKAWLKRNDTKYNRPIIDDNYHYGRFYILGCERYITSNVKGQYDTYEDLVDELFHRQLKSCESEEEKYFREHDEYSILSKRVEDKSRKYHTGFGVRLCFGSSDGILITDDNENYMDRKERKITLEELKELISKYEQIDKLIEQLTAETHIEY